MFHMVFLSMSSGVPTACLLLTSYLGWASGRVLQATGQVADAFHCSFDEGLCGIQQDLTDNFDWSRRANQTATHNTGPLCDPLRCASGYYVYTEASAPRRRNDRARLITPLLRGNGARCVTFYWHMFGSSMGSLIIKQLELDGTERLLWSQAGPQTNTWHLQQLDLSNVPALYKLVFEGVIGPSYQSDLAIDDINVWTGSCQDVIRNDCKFERDLCSWHNTGQISWQRNYGNTPTPGTGPTLGRHNVSTEYYLFVESSRTLPNDTAKLKSGELSGNLTGYCLQFWYHMFGSNIGQLSVLARSRSTGLKSSVWQHSGNSGNVWHRQAIYYTSPAQQDFSIIFEARLTGGSQGDIAIDDITVHAGQCETP